MGWELVQKRVVNLELSYLAFFFNPRVISQLFLMLDIFLHILVYYEWLDDFEIFGMLVVTYSDWLISPVLFYKTT